MANYTTRRENTLFSFLFTEPKFYNITKSAGTIKDSYNKQLHECVNREMKMHSFVSVHYHFFFGFMGVVNITNLHNKYNNKSWK